MIFVILGLRVCRGIRKSPFTGGAEALLRRTGRGGGDARADGLTHRRDGGDGSERRFWRSGKTGVTLRIDWGIWRLTEAVAQEDFAQRSCFWPSGFGFLNVCSLTL